MPAICFYFQVHQPWRIKKYRVFDIGNDHAYFNAPKDDPLSNRDVFLKVTEKCYLPTNKLMLDLLKKHPEFKISYSLSGTFLEQAEEFAPKILDSFKRLVDTDRVELLSETYYHSLSFLYSVEEFKEQVDLHREKIRDIFGYIPTTFRNTELIYRNDVASTAKELGFTTILAEGADHILKGKSPNFVYKPKDVDGMALLLKNYKLSDDIAFRFSDKWWSEHPLTSDKFGQWINAHNGNGELINLFMDYETFGEHQWQDSGIFDFLRDLPKEVLRSKDNFFITPREAREVFKNSKSVNDEIDFERFVSWADIERDLSAWLSNDMQKDAAKTLFAMENKVKKWRESRESRERKKDQRQNSDRSRKEKNRKKNKLLETWRRLQTSDHFYYMCTKWFNDGDVHKYFSPYESPYEAYIAYMNVLQDLSLLLEEKSA